MRGPTGIGSGGGRDLWAFQWLNRPPKFVDSRFASKGVASPREKQKKQQDSFGLLLENQIT